MPAAARARGDVVEVAEARAAERLDVDGRVAADGRHRPGRLEELAAGLDQVGRPGADLLRVADQQRRPAGRWSVSSESSVGPQQREQRLHPVDGDALGRAWPACRGTAPVTLVVGPRVVGGELERARSGRRRSAAARGTARRSSCRRRSRGSTAGRRPRTSASRRPRRPRTRRARGARRSAGRCRGCRRGPRTRRACRPCRRGCRPARRAGAITSSKSASPPTRQRDRLDVGEVGRHRLQQRAHRGDDNPQRRAEPLVVGIGQPAQHHHPRADGVDPGRQPLVRQRLPRREQRRPRRRRRRAVRRSGRRPRGRSR